LADFLLALHRPAPDDAPHNPGRGVPLADRAAAINDRIERLGPNITERVRRAWRDAVAAPRSNRRSWVHGDLHAANVLVDDGTFSAVIDWVDICAGDGATDLAAIWMLLPEPEERRAALDRYQPDDALHRRAIGWAVFFGTILLETGLVDNPRYRALGTAILTRIHHDTSE
ncbi:MAG: phosphotransferase, partial [Acidimicrobiia bacterium]|nr:phosphotransferase [Acidimicrobiia bacterium]